MSSSFVFALRMGNPATAIRTEQTLVPTVSVRLICIRANTDLTGFRFDFEMSPWPQYFIVRPGQEQITTTGQFLVQPGTSVPLIPIDLLPEWINISGLPRQLTPAQTAGMTKLGDFHRESGRFHVEIPRQRSDGDKHSTATTLVEVTGGGAHSNKPPSPTRSTSKTVKTMKAKPVPSSSSSPSATTTPSDAVRSPASIVFTPRRKPRAATSPPPPAPPPSTAKLPLTSSGSALPCRYWCRTGRCKWGVRCRNQHIMPTTPEGLEKAGLSRLPGWWLKRNEINEVQGRGEDVRPEDSRHPRHLHPPHPPSNCNCLEEEPQQRQSEVSSWTAAGNESGRQKNLGDPDAEMDVTRQQGDDAYGKKVTVEEQKQEEDLIDVWVS